MILWQNALKCLPTQGITSICYVSSTLFCRTLPSMQRNYLAITWQTKRDLVIKNASLKSAANCLQVPFKWHNSHDHHFCFWYNKSLMFSYVIENIQLIYLFWFCVVARLFTLVSHSILGCFKEKFLFLAADGFCAKCALCCCRSNSRLLHKI